MSEIVSINYCQPATKFHVWIFTATHKSDPGTNKYLCALSRLAQRAHISHHNFYPSEYWHLSPSIVCVTRVRMPLTRCLDIHLVAQWFSICQMSLGWMRRESEAIETRVCGLHLAESRAAQPAQTRWQTERRARRRINPRYHELFRAGESCLVLWAHCAGMGGEHNVQHMAWWYNSSVGGRIPCVFYSELTCFPGPQSCQMTIIQIIFQTQSHEERQEEGGGETLGSGARAQQGAAAWHMLLHLTCTYCSLKLSSFNAKENFMN